MILIRTTITEEKPFDVTVRAWPKMQRQANMDMGSYWYKHFLPRHFRYDAKEKYHHQKRTRGYMIRKQRMAAKGKAIAPGTVDNMLSGASRDAMLASVVIRAFPTRATVNMVTPSYFQMRPYKNNQPNKGEEIARVTADELQKLNEVGAASLEKQLKEFRARRVTKI